MKAKSGSYAKFEPVIIRRLLRYPLVAVVIHWAFQSLFYMDSTERCFKLGLDVILTGLGAVALGTWLPTRVAWPVAFLVAHTLNFLFNAQLWGVLKHYGLVRTSYDEFYLYVKKLGQRASHDPSIQSLLVYGSLARLGWSPSSDLDARIIRRPGFTNGLRACWFLLLERSRAFVARFPLDVYVLDDRQSLVKLHPDEKGIDLIDHF